MPSCGPTQGTDAALAGSQPSAPLTTTVAALRTDHCVECGLVVADDCRELVADRRSREGLAGPRIAAVAVRQCGVVEPAEGECDAAFADRDGPAEGSGATAAVRQLECGPTRSGNPSFGPRLPETKGMLSSPNACATAPFPFETARLPISLGPALLVNRPRCHSPRRRCLSRRRMQRRCCRSPLPSCRYWSRSRWRWRHWRRRR